MFDLPAPSQQQLDKLFKICPDAREGAHIRISASQGVSRDTLPEHDFDPEYEAPKARLATWFAHGLFNEMYYDDLGILKHKTTIY